MRRRPPCRDFGRDPRSKELAAQMRTRAGRISSLLREQLADIAEFDEAEAWRGDGASSMVHWVIDQCGVGASTARQWVRAAWKLTELPALAESLASGEMSLDKVAPLAEVATPDSDADVRDAAAHLTVKQARELAEWHRATEEALARAAGREFEHRTLRFNDTRRTMWVAFTRDEYAWAKSALVGRVATDDVLSRKPSTREQDQSGGEADALPGTSEAYVPYDQRLYDALIEIFHGAVDGHTGTNEPADGRSPRPMLRPQLILHAPLGLLMGIENGVAELEGVGPVAAEVARRLACDARVTLSVEALDGSVLDQGRLRREPTPGQRIEIARRDKGCRVPGCLYTEFTDVHHMMHWSKGGLTNLDNLITLCGRHHNAVHELGWTMRGDANAQVTFVSPTGQVMISVPSPTWRRTTGVAPLAEPKATPPSADLQHSSAPVADENQDPGESSQVRRR